MNRKKTKMLFASPDILIRDAWKQINLNRKKILIIVNDNKHLIGVVTDGDFRRWVLADKSLNVAVMSVINRNPLCASDKDSIGFIRKLMLDNEIEAVPVIDSKKKVVDVVFWSDIMQGDFKIHVTRKKINIPAVILAGGMGNRLDPFTRVLPKPLIPVGYKTIMELILDRFNEYGVNDFYVSLGYRSNMIKAYFKDFDQKYKLNFFQEAKPLGTAGPLKLIAGKIKQTFFVSNCDILVDADYTDILNFHKKNKYAITMVCSMKHIVVPYGVVQITKGGQLKNMKEKPEFDFFVSTGLYILEPNVLKLIPGNQKFHMTQLVDKVKKANGKIGVYPIEDKAWVDIGQLKEYKRTIGLLSGEES